MTRGETKTTDRGTCARARGANRLPDCDFPKPFPQLAGGVDPVWWTPILCDLGSQESARGLARRLNHYSTRGLLLIDEIGYLSYDARAADLLFQVVSRRYERRSLVLTTNLPFSDWPTIFPNAATATALIDRLVHHAEIIALEGDSYRRRVAETRKPLKTPPPA